MAGFLGLRILVWTISFNATDTSLPSGRVFSANLRDRSMKFDRKRKSLEMYSNLSSNGRSRASPGLDCRKRTGFESTARFPAEASS
jgi:hypothetical protein